MPNDELDPYETPAAIVAPGENVLSFDPEGNASVEHKKPDERPNTFKGSKQIQACDDDKIVVIGMRPRSGIVDYAILGVTVSYRGQGHGEKRQYLCHTHIVNDCPHTRRIHRYRQDHPEAAAKI